MSENYKYDLSVVIVNYNVEYFLDQCLDSVQRAIKNLKTEVIVVDNDSRDGSMKMIQEKYPWVNCIENKENTGFSKANNQAIAIAQGEFVLLLNPDTVVGEDTFEKCLFFMREHPEFGGLGIRMIDGKGEFLPESKRGLPTPSVAFFKIFGFSKLFPRSRKFGQYHAGHISETETAPTDILSGAFMFLRKVALDKVGLLDETFFMYGEDIDLSYRITLGGYKNVYFADSKIIHYKGESTKKSSVNYVFVFYRAMIIFAAKHFAGKKAKLFSLIINLAIYLRAGMALIARFIKSAFLPAIDCLYLTFGMFSLTSYWQKAHIDFPEHIINVVIPIYAIIWIGSSYVQGSYDKPVRIYKFLKGVLLGMVLILLVYAILPKSIQFSRLFIFVGAGWAITYFTISRMFLHLIIGKQYRLRSSSSSNFLIISGEVEFDRIKQLLIKTHDNVSICHNISGIKQDQSLDNYDEVIFSSKDLSFNSIIESMSELRKKGHIFKIAPPNASHLIGSNSIDTAGDLYILNLNALNAAENKRKKRLFDFSLALTLIIASPILLFSFQNKSNLLSNLFRVLTGNLSFIGFSQEARLKDVRLPNIKDGLLHPSDSLPLEDDSITEKLNLLYTRDYSMRKDFSIVLKGWRKLDR